MHTFIARQPVLDQQKRVYAYEFLYRPHADDGSVLDPDQESFQIIFDLCTLLNMEHLTVGKKVFIKASPELLLNSNLQRLPIEPTVIEISRVTEPTPELIAACEELKRSGYSIALNIFSGEDGLQPFIEIADFIKVNMLSVPEALQSDLPRRLAAQGKQFI